MLVILRFICIIYAMDKKIKYNKYDAGFCFFGSIIFPSVVSIIYMVLATIIAMLLGANIDDLSNNQVFIYFSLFISPIAFSSLFFIYNKKAKINWVNTLNIKSKISVLNIVLCVILAFICTFGFTDIVNMFEAVLKELGFKVQNDLPVKIDNIGIFFLMIFAMAILPAIFEELLFRGVIFNGLKDYNKWWAIFGSAILFSLMHLNIEQTVYPFIVGAVLAFVMLKTNNIIYPMIIHFLNNAIVIVVTYVSTVKNLQPTEFVLSVKSVVFAITYCITAILLIALIIKFLLKKQKKDSYTETKSDIIIEDLPKLNTNINKKYNIFLWAGAFVAIFVWVVDLISGCGA